MLLCWTSCRYSLLFNQTLKVILETILQMEFINLLLWIFAEQPISCFCYCVFLSKSFFLPFFIILTFCSHLLFLSTFSGTIFILFPFSLSFYIFIFFYTFLLFTCFDHLVMHSPHIFNLHLSLFPKSTWKETSQLLMILLFLCNERQDFWISSEFPRPFWSFWWFL